MAGVPVAIRRTRSSVPVKVSSLWTKDMVASMLSSSGLENITHCVRNGGSDGAEGKKLKKKWCHEHSGLEPWRGGRAWGCGQTP